MERNYSRVFGVEFDVQNGANFEIIKFALHYHKVPVSNCDFLGGVVITILGLQMAIGMWKLWEL